MANKRRHFVLPHSSVVGKKPSVYNASSAPAGVMKSELAVNIADGNEFLSTQNASGNIVSWWPVLEKGNSDNAFVKDSVVASNGTLNVQNVGEVAFGYNNVSSQESASDKTTWSNNSGTTLFSIGNGLDSENPSNAFEVRRDGTTFVGGNLNVVIDGDMVDITELILEDEKVTSAALNDLNTRKADRAEIPDVSGYFDNAEYVSSAKTINFYNGDVLKASIDATDFIKDGMVDSVTISGVQSGSSTVQCLVITFNTDSGKENINIPISDIFDSDQYYTKTEVNEELFALGQRCFQQCFYDEEGDTIYFANGELPNPLVLGQISTSAFTNVSDVAIDGTSIVSDKVAEIPVASFTGYGVVIIDEELDNSSVNPVTNEAVSKMFEKVEKVTASALNDLNERKQDVLTIDTELDSESQNPVTNAAITAMLEKEEEVVSSSLNDLNGRIIELQTQVSEISPEEIKMDGYVKVNEHDTDGIISSDTINQAFTKVENKIIDNEEVIASALNDVNIKIDNEISDVLGKMLGKVKIFNSESDVSSLSSGEFGFISSTSSLYFKFGSNVIKFTGTVMP